MKREFRSFTDAKKFACSLKLKNQNEWTIFCKSGKKPENIPADVYHTYKNKGWISWGDFLGTENIANQNKEYISYSEARKFIHSLGLKNQKEWRDYCNSGKKPNNIPTSPEKVYSKKRIKK